MSALDALLADLASRNPTPQQTLTRINALLPDDSAHRDLILAGSLSDNSDPLFVLAGTNGQETHHNTIIMLYIL